ncbi:sulfate reduction electron transfer complex DsrMKJOP subunit DsrK [Calderihabitans maritimus]|uniref:Fe-S oxidoreductase n=1 Tax=Calderihabitans maritimus TaxID=1246530 RepID=A0A1Z5HR74_9FIRM|nr:(Fe-S)-binding protein [Calderihabitans maritimus]GAW91770.1 Fe-S oxidoreductase [Calderihabitans maritimus]
MVKNRDLKPQDIGRPGEQLTKLGKLMELPAPYDDPDMEPPLTEPKDSWKEKHCASLDGYIGIDTLTRPQTKKEEEEFVKKFLSGLEKIFSDETNRNFIQPLLLSFEYCAKCNTCSEACHVYQASGKNEIYRPIFRSEVLRKIAKKYFTKSGKILGRFVGADINVNWETIARLGELAYRCNLCRRCAQTCPLGLDNALLAREIRKIFSQEMGIAPKPLHEKGTMLQLKTGSTTGITKPALLDMIEFIEEEIEEKTGKKIKIPIDKKGADILLVHNAGEFMSWPENPAAFAILFEEAGLDWTLSSEMMGYDNVNYGIWYDDLQAKKIALQQFKVAKDLGVNRIVIGECGHAHKAAAVSMDRIVTGEDNIPRESFLPILWDLVKTKKLKLDPSKNNFPVTLHDPCNVVRMMGVVQPQRNILKAICPQFREMTPHGVHNYCCGGGSGFAIMNYMNFPEFRNKVSSRMKFKQILDAFQDTVKDPGIPKYVCAPCSNCKGTMRDLLEYYGATEKFNIHYGGLVELTVNALVDIKNPFLEFLQE